MRSKKIVSLFSIFAFLVVSVFLISPASAAKKPNIKKISPSKGTQGEVVKVTIKGKKFSKKKSKNKIIVSGSGVKAKVTKASAKKLKANFTIDSSADAGKRKVQVKIGKKKSNKKKFTVKSSADVVAGSTTSDLGSVSAAGWDSIKGTDILTTGNPATGGHGALKDELVTITLQAAHDDNYLYVRAKWADTSESNTHNIWTYDPAVTTTSWTKSGNEDRWYMMFPITDVAGREGKTFAQAGCAMTCHLVDTGKQVVTNTTDTISSCGVCHPNSDTDPGSSFVHISSGVDDNCSQCHADREFDKDGADMAAPAGGAFDVWHWKAGRSAPLNLAEDQSIVGPAKRGGDGDDLTSKNDGTPGPMYIWTPASGKDQSDVILASKLYGDGAYYGVGDLWLSGDLAVWDDNEGKWFAADVGSLTSTVVVTDTSDITHTVTVFSSSKEVSLPTTSTLTVRRSIYNDDKVAEGSNGDLVSGSSYSNGAWTVVIKRKFDTGDSKDVKFESGKTYNFGIAVTDSSGINHKGSNLKTLLIQ